MYLNQKGAYEGQPHAVSHYRCLPCFVFPIQMKAILNENGIKDRDPRIEFGD